MPRQKKEKLIGLGLPANVLQDFIQLSYSGQTRAPDGYELDKELSNSRVKVYTKNNSKEAIIVHRGSVGAQDWLDNMSYIARGKVKGTKSYELHKAVQEKAIAKYGADHLTGVGHSRGGIYLATLQKELPPLKEVISYNKGVGFYNMFDTIPENQTDVRTKNDVVSLLSKLQKRPKKIIEIEATANPLDFNKAHQPAEIEKLKDQFIGLKEDEEPMTGSGRAPSPKTLEQLNKMLKTLEGKLAKINKGKVYKTTNKEKVEYELSYTKARIKNHETKGEDLIITKKKKYGNELPAKAKAYKAKAVTPKQEEPKKEERISVKFVPKKEEPKKEEPKKEEPKKKEKSQKQKDFAERQRNTATIRRIILNGNKNIVKKLFDELIPEKYDWHKEYMEKYMDGKATDNEKSSITDIFIKVMPEFIEKYNKYMEEMKTEEPKKEEPKSVKKGKSNKTADEVKNEFKKIFLEGDLEFINDALHNKQIAPELDILIDDDRMKRMKELQMKFFRSKATKEEFINEYNSLDNCEELMCKYGINSKAEYRKWIVKNHPDKGGTIPDADFKQIVKCAVKNKYCSKKTGGIFGWSDEEKEAKKAKQEAKRAERQAKYDARKKEQNVKIGELIVSLNALKKKKQAKKEATEVPKAEAEPEAEPKAEAVTETIEGGIFGWSDKEKADKAERKMLREEYYKTHNRQQNANYTFDKTARSNWKKEFYAKNTFKKADDTMPKAVDTIEQQGIDEAEQEMLGSGMYYLKEISNPTNPIFKYKRTFEIPTFIDPETEFLMGGAFTDMLGMNCNKEDGTCFNPTWERRKIRSQILSEYKIWYNPFAPPAAGTIRMAWLNPMIEERFKPIYDEFVARRNVNVGLPADASRDRFAQQMFSNITDGLSYIPGSNIATAGLTLASTLSDTKKEDGT